MQHVFSIFFCNSQKINLGVGAENLEVKRGDKKGNALPGRQSVIVYGAVGGNERDLSAANKLNA